MLWVITAVTVTVLGGQGICAQVPNDWLPMSYSHRVMLDQKSPFIMLWTPHDDAIDIEVQVSESQWTPPP